MVMVIGIQFLYDSVVVDIVFGLQRIGKRQCCQLLYNFVGGLVGNSIYVYNLNSQVVIIVLLQCLIYNFGGCMIQIVGQFDDGIKQVVGIGEFINFVGCQNIYIFIECWL